MMNDTHDGTEDAHLDGALLAQGAYDVDAGEHIMLIGCYD